MTTTFNDIKKALEASGYTVHTLPQEKTPPNECVLILSKLRLDVETPATYVARPSVWIGWTMTDPNEIVDKAAQMVTNIVARIHEATFVFKEPQIEILGQLYRVSITCEWKQIVTATPPNLP